MEKLRVLVAENHYKMRCFMVVLLARDFSVIGAVSDGEELVRSAIHLLPDVIVSDILMPRMGGQSARNELAAINEIVPFVFVTTLGKEVAQLLPNDSPVALVHKDDMFDHLNSAVAWVFAGSPFLSPHYRDYAPSPTTLRLREFLKKKHLNHGLNATVLRLLKWADTLETTASEIARIPTEADSVELIAEALLGSAGGIERQLLLKSVQEALYYCIDFASNLTGPQITVRLKRFLSQHGRVPLVERFLSLYFFNAVWFHTAESFRGEMITMDVLEHDQQQIENICHEAIVAVYQDIQMFDARTAQKLIDEIEQRLRTIINFEQ